eukprot:6456559-Amphidinium_carterae.2
MASGPASLMRMQVADTSARRAGTTLGGSPTGKSGCPTCPGGSAFALSALSPMTLSWATQDPHPTEQIRYQTCTGESREYTS